MEDVLEHLPDPKVVGAAEYTVAHELAEDMLANGANPLEVQHAMDELSRWARRILIELTRKTNTF